MTGRVFDRIYKSNSWNGIESRSGPGSGRAATRNIARELVDTAAEYRVASVLDLGCGDGLWMPDLPGYVGYDPSSAAIAYAEQNHPDRRYVRTLPNGAFDMVIVRDAIQHLPLRTGAELLALALAYARRVLVASTYVPGWNEDVAPGGFYSPSLTSPPFDMPSADRLIFDGYDYEHGDTIRDPSKYLGVWAL